MDFFYNIIFEYLKEVKNKIEINNYDITIIEKEFKEILNIVN
jgi:hypothetical protein